MWMPRCLSAVHSPHWHTQDPIRGQISELRCFMLKATVCEACPVGHEY